MIKGRKRKYSATLTPDRQILELAEARELRMSYHHNVNQQGKLFAAQWLADRIAKLESIYGKDFGVRCRKLMRYVEDVELVT